MAENFVLSPFQVLAKKALESGRPQTGGPEVVNAFKDSVSVALNQKIQQIRSERQHAYDTAGSVSLR